MTDIDQYLSNERKRDIHALKNAEEFWQHVGHEKEHDTDARSGDESRINQRGSEFGLNLGEALEMIRHAAKHFNEGTAGFAGADHVDIEVRKDARLLGHGIGETAALHHVLPQFATHIS